MADARRCAGTQTLWKLARMTLAMALGLVLLNATNGSAQQKEPEADDKKASPANTQLSITFLANEGFLIRQNNQALLIDGFIKDAYYGYGALPAEEYVKLIKGQKPFAGIQVGLTTHIHQDHFQAATAIDFLSNNPNCEFVSTKQVVAKMRQQKKTTSGINRRIMSLWPDAEKVQTINVRGIRIDAFRLRHANPRNYKIQNLGFIVHLGNLKILHVGDAESRSANFDGLGLNDKEIDVAILPFWMFANKKLVTEQVAAKKYIAAHIPVAQVEKIKHQLAESDPGVEVFETPLESRTFETDLRKTNSSK